MFLAGANRRTACGASNATLFEGARLITGDGGAPIEDSAFVIENDRFVSVGKKGEITPPVGAAFVDLSGKTVMPALVDAHSHLGYTDVKRNTTAAANFTRVNLVDHLKRYAYYGIAATLSMGVDRGELPYEVRANPVPGAALFRTAGRGIALPNAGPGAEYRKDAAYGVTTEAEARKAVQELAAKKVDIVKIWVDDRDGTVKKLPPPMYRAIIDEAHKNNLRVVAHIFDLADAKELLRSGIDGFAHGVRDKDIDDEFMTLIKQHPNVFVIPNLPDRGVAEADEWLSETVPAGRGEASPGSPGQTHSRADQAAERAVRRAGPEPREAERRGRDDRIRHRRGRVRRLAGPRRARRHGDGGHDAGAGHRRGHEDVCGDPQARPAGRHRPRQER